MRECKVRTIARASDVRMRARDARERKTTRA
jgi:hypothetical protein